MPHLDCFGIARNNTRLFDRDDSLACKVASESQEDLTRLDAIITDVNIGGSEPALQVRAPDGVNWTVELAKHSQNIRAGLTDAMALPGDSVSIVGHSVERLAEHRIKALRLTIVDRHFNLYPD